MCVGAFLRQKTAVFVALLFTVLCSFSVITCASTGPFPHKGDLHLPQGTTVISENAVTGIEEGDLYIPSGATLHLESNATFIWNPGYSIHNEGQITWDTGGRLRQGYLCVSVDGIHGCWQDPTFCADLPCPLGYVRWKDVWDLPSCDVAATIYVPDDCLTIQGAVDAASPGDTIIVRDGSYVENVNVDKDHLTIRAQNGAQTTIVQAANSSIPVFEVRANHVEINGFTVSGASGTYAAGIHIMDFEQCVIRDNVLTDNYEGIFLVGDAENNRILNNTVSSNVECGIRLYAGPTNNEINGNTVLGNECGVCLGVGGDPSNENTVINNTVRLNERGILINGSSGNMIKGNSISDSMYGIVFFYGSSGNRVINNYVSTCTYGVYHHSDVGPNEIYLNNYVGNTITARGSDRYSSLQPLGYSYKQDEYTSYLGNYWDDYLGIDANGDGVGDTPYTINSDSDNYPLMEPFENYILLEDTGTVTGRVTDASTGEGIAGATVEAEEPPVPLSIKEEASPAQAGTTYSTTTDANGDYTLYLPEGAYGMTAAAEGYELGMGGATVTAGEITTVNFSLIPLASENHPPDPPVNLAQLLPDGTAIPVGDAVSTDTVLFKGTVTDSDGDTVKLQVELRRLDELGGNFDDTQDGLKESSLVSSGSEATCTANGLISGDYHWRARAIDEHDLASNWVDFGDNALAEADFTIPPADTTPPALIQGFTASDGEDGQCTLSWTNPVDSDLNQVVVKRKITGYPSGYADGDTRITIDAATPGREGTFVDGGLTNGQSYYYAVFSCDAEGNWNDQREEGKNADIGNPYTGILLTVPYYNQGDTYWCWAASAAMLLKYHGFDVEPWDIAASLDPILDGAVGFASCGRGPTCMVIENPATGSPVYRYIERNFDGLCGDDWVFDFYLLSHIDPSPLKARIISLLSEGSPVYMSVWAEEEVIDKPELQGHDVVIVGYSDASDTLYFHDPSGALGAGRIHAGLAWQDFVERAAPDSVRIPIFIVGRSDCLSGEGEPLSISVLHQTAFTFKDGHSLLDFGWDGREEYGYEYRPVVGSVFPEDPVFGYATTLKSSVVLTASLANASGAAADNVQIKAEIFSLPSNALVKQIAQVETDLSGYDDKGVIILNAIPLSTFITEPGSYRLLLSIVNPATHDVSDTCAIRFRVASETPVGQGIQEPFPDGLGSISLNNVTNTGNTNIVEIDASETETGDIQVLGKAYSIHTTATFEGDVTISIHYDDSGLTLSQERNLKMYKVVDTSWWNWWEDRIDITQSVDTDLNVITGRTDSFSTFFLGYETGTIPPDKMINHGPNPVPSEGCIFWLDLPDDTVDATLKIFDIDGALLVSILLDATADRYPAAGRWLPEDDQGRLLGTGLYLYLVEIEHTDGTITYSAVQKMVIQR